MTATLLGELHVDIHVIQRILGHAQVTTTRIYTDPTDPLNRQAADLIGELLRPADAQPGKLGWSRNGGNCNPDCNRAAAYG